MLKQTIKDIEIICINDGSTDKSLTILERSAKNDTRIKVITQENKGQAAARNKGLDTASGDYVIFLDSDDALSPVALETFYNIATQTDYPLIVGSKFISDIDQLSTQLEATYKTFNDGIKDILNFGMGSSSACNKLYQMSLIKDKRFIEGIYFEDWPFITSLFAENKDFALTNAPLYFYNQENSSTMRSSFSSKKIMSYITGIRFIYTLYKNKPELKYAKKRIIKAIKMCVNMAYKDKKQRKILAPILIAELKSLAKDKVFAWHKLPLKVLIRIFKMKAYYKKELKLEKVLLQVSKNYNEKLDKLSKQKSKIRVAFLVSENSKWQYQSVFEEMQKEGNFDPFVLVTLLTSAHKGKDKTRYNLKENYDFFKKRNIPVYKAYDEKKKKYINLNKFNPDLVFYQQPWEIAKNQNITEVSKFALTFYVPYGLNLIENKNHYMHQFHALLYKYFTTHQEDIERYKNLSTKQISNCLVVGHPRLDEYFNKINNNDIWKKTNKIKVIYAPHHSFEANSLKFATFQWSGITMLNLAEKYKDEITWVLKPHPRFNHAVIKNNIMTEKELDAYYDEWNKYGKLYSQGDYFDLFRTSDALITDCVSFLAEYLPTEKPVIQLARDDSTKFNKTALLALKHIYSCYNTVDLSNLVNSVIVNKEDTEKNARCEIAKTFLSPSTKSAQIIILELMKLARKENCK